MRFPVVSKLRLRPLVGTSAQGCPVPEAQGVEPDRWRSASRGSFTDETGSQWDRSQAGDRGGC